MYITVKDKKFKVPQAPDTFKRWKGEKLEFAVGDIRLYYQNFLSSIQKEEYEARKEDIKAVRELLKYLKDFDANDSIFLESEKAKKRGLEDRVRGAR